jgi:hypothetical protein
MPTITRANARAFRRPLFRPDPVGPPQAYRTYQISAPVQTHFRKGTCEEAGCLQHHNGFMIKVDLDTDLGRRQADYLTYRSGRRFRKEFDGPTLLTFHFPPGTPCFQVHKIRLDRPALYVVRDGDWRRYERTRVLRSDQWVDNMQSTLDNVRSQT